jgi:DNA-binding response OmpR family regulator
MFDTAAMRGIDDKIILVVEDSPTQALRLRMLLEQEGLKVVLAGNGRAGLEMAQQLHPDAIVLDLEMPQMNGFQVCQELQGARATATIPIIMLTRHIEHETVVLGRQLGAIEYIPKDDLAEIVLLETLREMGLIAPQPEGM